MEILNQTPFPAMAVPHYDAEGREIVSCVVKGTFSLVHGQLPEPREREEQCPIALADEYWGEPAASVLKLESDLAPFKPASDVVLLGFAYDRRGRPTRRQEVSLELGPVRKRSTVSAEEAKERLPLTLLEPAGVTKGWLRAPRPKQGFGFFPRYYKPRLDYAGTYDDAWQRSRAPFLPSDFDYRFFQAAYPDLVCPTHLRGDEAIELANATPEGRLSTRLPGLALQIEAIYDGERRREPAALDTVVLEPEEKRLLLVWRRLFPCRGPFQNVLGLRIASAEGAA
jgi:hypothetical protein